MSRAQLLTGQLLTIQAFLWIPSDVPHVPTTRLEVSMMKWCVRHAQGLSREFSKQLLVFRGELSATGNCRVSDIVGTTLLCVGRESVRPR